MFEDLANSIQQLILSGKGDVGRLEYILDMLKRGKILPYSDQKYLENVLPLYLSSQDLSSSQYEHKIEQLHREIETLNEKIIRLEKKGFKKYIGKKTILFFVTVFVGWNVMQSFVISLLNLDMSNDMLQYLFPLNIITSYFNANSILVFVFILMLMAWPFIGMGVLVNSIKIRKLVT